LSDVAGDRISLFFQHKMSSIESMELNVFQSVLVEISTVRREDIVVLMQGEAAGRGSLLCSVSKGN
jgi:hypothetical protein